MTSQNPQEEWTLIEWFDDKLDEFHDWLEDIKDRREQNIQEIVEQEIKALPVSRTKKKGSGVELSRQSSIRFRLVWAAVAMCGYFLFKSLDLVYIILTWFILSMASERFIIFFQKWIPRWLAIFLVYILLFLFIFSGIIIIIPFLVQQTSDLITMVIDRAVVLQTEIQENGIQQMVEQSILPWSIKDSFIGFLETTNIQESIQSTLVENISQIVGMWTSYIKNAGDFAVSLVSWTFSALLQIFIIFMVAIFCSLDKDGVVSFASSFSSTPEYTRNFVLRIYDKLWHRLVWQIILSVAIGFAVAIGLQIIWLFGYDLPNKFTLSIIAWLTEFIPYLWPILWGIPGLFVAILAYGWKWLLVAMFMYYVVQWLENNVLVPLIMSQTLGVSPLVIFVAMLIMWSLLWLIWIIIAVPVAVILHMMYLEYIKVPQLAQQKMTKSTTKTKK